MSGLVPASGASWFQLNTVALHSRWAPQFSNTIDFAVANSTINTISSIQGSVNSTLSATNTSNYPLYATKAEFNNKAAYHTGQNNMGIVTANAAGMDVANGAVSMVIMCNTQNNGGVIFSMIKPESSSTRWDLKQNTTGTDYTLDLYCFDGSNFKTFHGARQLLSNTAYVVTIGSVGNVYKMRINGTENISSANTHFWDDVDIVTGSRSVPAELSRLLLSVKAWHGLLT